MLTDEQAQEIFANEHCNISKELAGILARAIEAAVLPEGWVAMTEGQALDYFNAALKHGSLCAGINYMIDRDDTVWECVVWAGGGIWYVKPTKRERTKEYHELRRYAAIQRRTTFEARIETHNAVAHREAACGRSGGAEC